MDTGNLQFVSIDYFLPYPLKFIHFFIIRCCVGGINNSWGGGGGQYYKLEVVAGIFCVHDNEHDMELVNFFLNISMSPNVNPLQ